MPSLERVLQGLHESEISCGIRNEPPAGGITAWIDYGSRTERATFYGTIVGDRQVWPIASRRGCMKRHCVSFQTAPLPRISQLARRAHRRPVVVKALAVVALLAPAEE
jgi:hypothetical protein